jgi:hypothetical protein
MCTAAISSLEGSAVIADYVFRFRSISGGYASLQWLSRALSTSRGRLAECTNRLQLAALIRESPRVDVSRPSRCSCPCGNSAARGRTGLSSSSTKASPSAFNAPGGLPDDPSRHQADAIPGAVEASLRFASDSGHASQPAREPAPRVPTRRAVAMSKAAFSFLTDGVWA